MTPAGAKGKSDSVNTPMSEQHRAKQLQKAQQRVENMELGYMPSNLNPVNIEIGPSGGSHRVLEEDNDTLGDVRINDNLSIGN